MGRRQVIYKARGAGECRFYAFTTQLDHSRFNLACMGSLWIPERKEEKACSYRCSAAGCRVLLLSMISVA